MPYLTLFNSLVTAYSNVKNQHWKTIAHFLCTSPQVDKSACIKCHFSSIVKKLCFGVILSRHDYFSICVGYDEPQKSLVSQLRNPKLVNKGLGTVYAIPCPLLCLSGSSLGLWWHRKWNTTGTPPNRVPFDIFPSQVSEIEGAGTWTPADRGSLSCLHYTLIKKC